MDRGDRRMSAPHVLQRMQALCNQWSSEGDRREVFLRCYGMMTSNMHAAIGRGDFIDSVWVDRLLHRFAEYYFEALERWDTSPDAAPAVWQLAHGSTGREGTAVWQHLLLGVNAHINFDLVLTVHELLEDEWAGLSPEARLRRHDDYCRVNAIIADTIDAVQDEVLAPSMPSSVILDRLMGRIDEYMISRLVTSWRDRTWDHALRLLETCDGTQRLAIVAEVEEHALRLAARINLGRE